MIKKVLLFFLLASCASPNITLPRMGFVSTFCFSPESVEKIYRSEIPMLTLIKLADCQIFEELVLVGMIEEVKELDDKAVIWKISGPFPEGFAYSLVIKEGQNDEPVGRDFRIRDAG